MIETPFIRLSTPDERYSNRPLQLPSANISIWFSTNQPIDININGNEPLIVRPENIEEINNYFFKASELYNKNPQENYLECKGICLILLGYFLKNYNRQTSDMPPFITSALNYIDVHRDRMENLNIQDIAEKFNVNYEYFIRQFKKHIGISPKQYILNIKMEYVRMLITNSQLPISQISKITGFSSITYFYDCFKNYYGTTPLKYRNEHNKITF